MLFINRETELDILGRALDASSPALFVLYGRRRVGKSALLRRVCGGRRHVFYTADLGSRQDQLTSFSACLAQGLDVLRDLEAKVPAVTADLERAPPSRVDLALFSRSGFTPELREEAERRSISLITVEEMLLGTRTT